MKITANFKRYKIFLVILQACFIFSTVFAQKELQEILVFAGAGMWAPLDEIGKKIEKLYGIKVIYDYRH